MYPHRLTTASPPPLSSHRSPRPAGVPDYRKTFDTQRSNLLASEMKNNAARLAKYTITVSAKSSWRGRMGAVGLTEH